MGYDVAPGASTMLARRSAGGGPEALAAATAPAADGARKRPDRLRIRAVARWWLTA